MPDRTYNALEFDDIFKVLVSAMMALPFIIINSPVLVPQLIAGWLLHCYKCLHLRQTYNFWVTLYTGSDEVEIDTIMDRQIFNETLMLQTLIQSLPMFMLITFNSILLHTISIPAVMALIFSGLMILNAVHKVIWYKLYLLKNVVNARIGLEDDIHDKRLNDDNDWNDYINEVEMGNTYNTSRNLNKKSMSVKEMMSSPKSKGQSVKTSKTFDFPLNSSSFSKNPLMESQSPRSANSSKSPNKDNQNNGNNNSNNVSKKRIEQIEMNIIGFAEEIKTIKSTVGKGFFGVQESIQNLTSSQDKTSTKVKNLRDNQLRLMEKIERISLLQSNNGNNIDEFTDIDDNLTIETSLYSESTI